ncbi:MAG: hypothetical protein H7070_07750 [Saprospiraceae bacterium]|nr:hypothetical protein [Pyrinomonadaceae bacterium]
MNWSWPQIFIVVILLLGGVHLYRVNAVRPGGAANLPKFISTTGAVVDGPLVVQAESFLPLKMDFNARVTLKGWFATGSARSRIECLVLNKDAFELWKNGREYQAVAKTGYLPSGRIERVLEPETYYLIFDNQRAGEPEKEFNAFFEIE